MFDFNKPWYKKSNNTLNTAANIGGLIVLASTIPTAVVQVKMGYAWVKGKFFKPAPAVKLAA